MFANIFRPNREPVQYFAPHPPGYPLAIRFFQFLVAPFARHYVWLSYLLSNISLSLLFSSLATCLFYHIVKQFGYSRKPLLLATLFIFFPPNWIVWKLNGMSEPIALSFAMLAFLAYKRQRYLYSGIAAGLSTILNFEFSLLLPIWSILLLRRRKVGAVANFTFIPLAVLASFVVDYLLYGDFWAYFHVQAQYFIYYRGLGLVASYPFQLVVLSIKSPLYPPLSLYGGFLVTVSSFLLFGLSTFRLARKDKELCIYSLVILLANSMILHPDVARYLLADWPMLIGFAGALTSRRSILVAKYLIVPCLCLFGCIYTILFYYWVGYG